MSDADRKKRLAQALRDNLKRRKAQAREAVSDHAPDDPQLEEPQRQEIHVPACAAAVPHP